MKKWIIPVTWSEKGVVEIEANTLADAMNKVSNAYVPTESEILDDSMEIDCYDEDTIRDIYNDGQSDDAQECEYVISVEVCQFKNIIVRAVNSSSACDAALKAVAKGTVSMSACPKRIKTSTMRMADSSDVRFYERLDESNE